MTPDDEIRDIFAEIEKEHSDKEITFPCKQCLLNGIKKGFEAGQKSSTQKILGEIDKLIENEKDCMEQDKYEEQEIEHINQIEMANKIKFRLADVYSPVAKDKEPETRLIPSPSGSDKNKTKGEKK